MLYLRLVGSTGGICNNLIITKNDKTMENKDNTQLGADQQQKDSSSKNSATTKQNKNSSTKKLEPPNKP